MPELQTEPVWHGSCREVALWIAAAQSGRTLFVWVAVLVPIGSLLACVGGDGIRLSGGLANGVRSKLWCMGRRAHRAGMGAIRPTSNTRRCIHPTRSVTLGGAQRVHASR